MKLPTDHIYKLIHAMSASEKRYFKRHYASETSLLTTLFDFINSMRNYDEEVVKSHFSDSKLSKNLKVYKVQLAELLLKSLVSYHSKNSVHSKIRIGLEELDILIGKQLFDIALSKIKRIKAICLEYDAYEHLFPILALELSLNSFYSANPGSIQTSTFHELDESIIAVQEILSLQRYSHQLSDIKNHLSTQTLTEGQHVLYTNLLSKLLSKLGEENSFSFREQYYQYHVISMIYRLVLNDPEQEYFYKSEQIRLLKENEKISNAYPALYFASMHNYLSSCWKLKRYEALDNGIADIQSFIRNNPVLEPNKLFVYYLQISLFFGKNLAALEESFEKEVLAHIKKYKQSSDYLSNLIYLRLALIHLTLNHHKKVQFFLRRINENTPTMNKAFSSVVVVVDLMSHYQSDDLFLVKNIANAQLRKRKKKDSESSKLFEDILLFFQQLARTSEEEQVTQLAKDFKSQILEAKDQTLSNWLKEYLFYDWLDALANKTPLKDQIQQIAGFAKK